MIRPFIKWAGGKTRVLPDLLPLLPKGDCLIEPFVGSASVFLNTDFSSYVLADINPDLINLYRCAAYDTERLITTARDLFNSGNNAGAYNANRLSFNYQKSDPSTVTAALFLYLNRHGFNGLCRYNNSGDFNIPFGQYKKTYFPEQEIRQFAEKANDTETIFSVADFRKTLTIKGINKSTVIYCDPPYLPSSDTANFTQYHTSAFTPAQHRELADVLLRVNRETGASIVISNSDTPTTREIYQHYQFHEIAVQRSVSANGISRGAAKEVIGVLKTCDGCGCAGGGCCPDCGPCMGDATYQEMVASGVFDGEAF
ncbi:Dam family site-specific DNA-(adenine-N6)-methyltransferase [Pectobacterium carotovorum]|uniref:Dam family site-specific DNA-(adenine-N6)-methyltransferase n=1 Tax=Pectobacterium carotovorum TaxID=554 RepID=UPI0005809F5D|nr:Dam family site-specific DNA-(adenine-N6)-methyltransferase [Pectobacterium carotovorum]KHT18074.1 adenine methylase [Pectobacterium carotovorum subsp. carotovorum]MCA6974436.1 Dam family site-specific DNA-(adenine-N6)-methyltransferase [Pectobacterium carotovorum]